MGIEVLFDGMDLSGKSTIAKQSSETFGIALNRGKLARINPILGFTVPFGKTGDYDTEIMDYLYLAAAMYDVKNYTDDNIPTIQDSSMIVRTLAFNIEKDGSKHITDELLALLKKHPIPKQSYYLYANLQDRIKRLDDRKVYKPVAITDAMLINDPKRFERLDGILREISQDAFKSKLINTSSTSITEVVQTVGKDIGRY